MIPTVGELMSENTYSIGADKTIEACAIEMTRKKIGSLMVSRGGEFIGIITECDITRKVVAQRLDPAATSVEKVMAAPLITIGADRSVVDADALMEDKKVRHLGVRRNGKVVGFISVRDLLHPLYIKEEAVGF